MKAKGLQSIADIFKENIMKQTIFRDLRPDEIEVRVGNIIKDKDGSPKGFQLLLYKTSRTDMAILDETFGTFGWRNRFYQVKNTMVCSIEIYDEEKKEWINKDNGGDDDTAMEQVKSELSDSIKRAGSTLGIGRKLYSANKIYMVVDIDKDNNTKSYYQVKDIDYDEKGITKLVIINKKTKQVVISYGSNEKVSKIAQETPKKDILADATQGIADEFGEIAKPISKDDLTFLQAYVGNLGGTEYTQFFTWLKGKYGVSNVVDLTEEQGRKLAYYLKNRGK